MGVIVPSAAAAGGLPAIVAFRSAISFFIDSISAKSVFERSTRASL